MKSMGDIGCNMMYSTTQKLYNFVLFDGTQLTITNSIKTANLPSGLSPYTTMFLNNNSYLSPDCRLLSVNGSNYFIDNSMMVPINTPIANYTNTTMATFGDYFYFLTSSKVLYKYNFVNN
jgi:hypothetical protein